MRNVLYWLHKMSFSSFLNVLTFCKHFLNILFLFKANHALLSSSLSPYNFQIPLIYFIHVLQML